MTERAQLLERLQSAAVEVLGDEAPTLSEEQTLEDASVDSLDLVEIIMVVEEAEGFTIDADDLAEATSVADIIDVLVAKRAAQ